MGAYERDLSLFEASTTAWVASSVRYQTPDIKFANRMDVVPGERIFGGFEKIAYHQRRTRLFEFSAIQTIKRRHAQKVLIGIVALRRGAANRTRILNMTPSLGKRPELLDKEFGIGHATLSTVRQANYLPGLRVVAYSKQSYIPFFCVQLFGPIE
ncbi:hypothetical protein B0J17DRAFT_633160 [Rhizoctonia solani]|nr:hypothetical protein B0J17DRAFT_633160 [Rhizoctonia solani]